MERRLSKEETEKEKEVVLGAVERRVECQRPVRWIGWQIGGESCDLGPAAVRVLSSKEG